MHICRAKFKLKTALRCSKIAFYNQNNLGSVIGRFALFESSFHQWIIVRKALDKRNVIFVAFKKKSYKITFKKCAVRLAKGTFIIYSRVGTEEN